MTEPPKSHTNQTPELRRYPPGCRGVSAPLSEKAERTTPDMFVGRQKE